MIIDALTANVLILGMHEVVTSFHLSFQTPLPSLAGDTIENIVRACLFVVLFYFLMSDWAEARRIDAKTPYKPSPGGWRLYVDLMIVGLFYPAFMLAARLDQRLAPLMAGIFLAGAIWCLLVAKKGEADTALLCTQYMWTHLIGCGLFICVTAFYYLPNQPPFTVAVILLIYVLWELIDRNMTRAFRSDSR